MIITAYVLLTCSRLLGLATHFVPSDQLDFVHENLVKLYRPNRDTIDKNIKQFAIKLDDIPVSYILQHENMNTIKRYGYKSNGYLVI